MSSESRTDEEQQNAEATEPPIEDLMSSGDTSGAPDATTAQAGATTDSASGATSKNDGSPPTTKSAPAQQKPPSNVDRILQVLLLANLALIGGILLLPNDPPPVETTHTEPAVQEPTPTETQSESMVHAPRNLGHTPPNQLWEQSVKEAGNGNFPLAIRLLQTYLETDNEMIDVEKRLVFNQLAHYLLRDGRVQEAQEYERKSHQIMTRSYLPEDLLKGAHRAAEAGEVTAMRSAYARFLLQQKQIPPTLRKHVAEAYLKLGDSYRLEAKRAEAEAESEELEQRRASLQGAEGHK